MKQEFLTQFPHIYLVVFGLLLFLFSFTAIFIRTYSKKRSEAYEHLARLPMDAEGEG